MNTDTPRTDAYEVVDGVRYVLQPRAGFPDLSAFARQLERELIAAKASEERAIDFCIGLSGRNPDDIRAAFKERDDLRAIIARIRAEVDQYADGAIDASAHDQLANTILGMLPPEIAIA